MSVLRLETGAFELGEVIGVLESFMSNPADGLPEELFLFISRVTPLINVDLLIKNEQNQTLLTWRDDGCYPPGWHVPGGIIRYKETIVDRVKMVAKNELGVEVEFYQAPMAINEIIKTTQKNRGHFISLLYKCSLITQPDERLMCKGKSPNPNEWMWHRYCPADIIPVHEIYRNFI
jgi:colanic acid biosynthesis protein WcaH